MSHRLWAAAVLSTIMRDSVGRIQGRCASKAGATIQGEARRGKIYNHRRMGGLQALEMVLQWCGSFTVAQIPGCRDDSSNDINARQLAQPVVTGGSSEA